MTPKEALDKIRQLFSDPTVAAPAPEAEPAKMEAKEYVLEGGAKVMVSSLEPGGMVSLVDDAGNATPAPAGDHKLADGTMITVGENGVISAVVMPEAPVEGPVEDMNAVLEAKMAAIREDVRKENEAVRAIMEGLAKQEDFKASVDEINAKLKGLADAMTALLQTPSTDPIEAPKDKFEKQETANQKLKGLAETLERLRNKS